MTEIAALKRDVTFLKLYSVAATVALGLLALLGAKGEGASQTLERLTVERIDIVDAAGKRRMVLTGPQHMPGAGGPDDRRPDGRNFVAPAILFYDDSEKEFGGIVPRTTVGEAGMTALIFDYATQEAGGFFTQQKTDGTGFAALLINDPPPASMPHAEAITKSFNRIKIMNPDRNAEVVLSDASGRNRIQMRVTKEGDAYLEILDRDGKVAFRAPESEDAH